MQRYQSYKFELRPNGEQVRQMRRIAGCCRFVFNQALAAQMERRARGETELDFAELSLRLAECRWRPETKWLAQVSFGCLQQSLRNLESAQAGYRSGQTRAPRIQTEVQWRPARSSVARRDKHYLPALPISRKGESP